jgi:hypothetical protein
MFMVSIMTAETQLGTDGSPGALQNNPWNCFKNNSPCSFPTLTSSMDSFILSINNILGQVESGLPKPRDPYGPIPVPRDSSYAIEYFSAIYIPPTSHNSSTIGNCNLWESDTYTNTDIGCKGYDGNGPQTNFNHNSNWKRTVSCTLLKGELCQFTIEEYQRTRGTLPPGSGAPSNQTPGETINVTINYTVKILGTITDKDGTIGKGCVNNLVTATIGTPPNTFSNTGRTSTSVNGAECASADIKEPFPSQLADADIINTLCTKYRVCPTAMTGVEGWDHNLLEPLWNITQKLYANQTITNLAIGTDQSIVLEIQLRNVACTGCYDWVVGYHHGLNNTSDAHLHPPSRMVGMKSSGVHRYSKEVNEHWFMIHEIGHAISAGHKDGTFQSTYSGNPEFSSFYACTGAVSDYGSTGGPGENIAEAIAFYFGRGEKVNGGYRGSSGDMKVDFPCQYNALQSIFDGTEFSNN